MGTIELVFRVLHALVLGGFFLLFVIWLLYMFFQLIKEGIGRKRKVEVGMAEFVLSIVLGVVLLLFGGFMVFGLGFCCYAVWDLLTEDKRDAKRQAREATEAKKEYVK